MFLKFVCTFIFLLSFNNLFAQSNISELDSSFSRIKNVVGWRPKVLIEWTSLINQKFRKYQKESNDIILLSTNIKIEFEKVELLDSNIIKHLVQINKQLDVKIENLYNKVSKEKKYKLDDDLIANHAMLEGLMNRFALEVGMYNSCCLKLNQKQLIFNSSLN